MANPELIRGFDLNDTNTEAIPEAKITDGYEQEEVLLSKNYNEVLKQLFAAANKNKNDGIWEWEDPTTNDTEYNIGSLVSHNGENFESLKNNNEVEPVNDGINWRSLSNSDTKLFAIAGGTANAITVTIPAIKEYSVNSTFRAKATITSTDAVTINVNALGDKDVVIDNTALSGGEIVSSKEYFFTYSSNGNFELTDVGISVNTLTDKETPDDTDNLVIQETGQLLKKLSWSNLKATLKTYFDTIYASVSQLLGVGQTWQDLTASRSLGVTYTNSTGKAIVVYVSVQRQASDNNLFYIDNVLFGQGANFSSSNIYGEQTFVVPNGNTYKVSASGGLLVRWSELR
jgi:hypothetical protein